MVENGGWTWSVPTTDGPDETVNVQLTADDDNGGVAIVTFPLYVLNGAPVINSISGPAGPLALGAEATILVDYVDPGSPDSHVCEFSWDDDVVSPTVTYVDGAGSGTGQCAGAFEYTQAGVHTIQVVVTDDDGESDHATYEFVVVYDPSAGFVTGGGHIDSLAGSLVSDPSAEGRANFGFVAKYRKGKSIPEGQTQFQFVAGDLNFHSVSYEWLVVAGRRAQFRGTGTIGGAGDYGFLLTANDGDLHPSQDEPDMFRIKIWDRNDSDAFVYDDKMGSGDDIDSAEAQAIDGGSIVIHGAN